VRFPRPAALRSRPARAAADAQNTLFQDFRIESNNNNEIWIELQLDSLLRVLKSAESCGASLSLM
jgi:hypothetical protein